MDGRTRRQIASALVIAAVILAGQATLRQIGRFDRSALAIDALGVALLASAALFVWWLSKREPGARTMRAVGAIGGAWLGAGIGLALAEVAPISLLLRVIAIAPIYGWLEPFALVGLVAGGAIGALLAR